LSAELTKKGTPSDFFFLAILPTGIGLLIYLLRLCSVKLEKFWL